LVVLGFTSPIKSMVSQVDQSSSVPAELAGHQQRK
jgi:hypothetical protein